MYCKLLMQWKGKLTKDNYSVAKNEMPSKYLNTIIERNGLWKINLVLRRTGMVLQMSDYFTFLKSYCV